MDYDKAMKEENLNGFVENIVKVENRYYQEVTIAASVPLPGSNYDYRY